jgi:acyl-coenzyme A synthetase/AMP-(fatty) acid ligase
MLAHGVSSHVVLAESDLINPCKRHDLSVFSGAFLGITMFTEYEITNFRFWFRHMRHRRVVELWLLEANPRLPRGLTKYGLQEAFEHDRPHLRVPLSVFEQIEEVEVI